MELLILVIVFMVFAAVMSVMIFSPFVAVAIVLWNTCRVIGRACQARFKGQAKPMSDQV